MDKICILIPAYNPDERLTELYTELKNTFNVVIVDDGSADKAVFNSINPKNIIVHPVNMGKGEALKSGMKYIIENFPNTKGIVTADCDLQHSVADITKLATQLNNSPDKVYFGSRDFSGKTVPFRSKFGNIIMSKFIKLIHKIDVKDTQTGLRGLPIDFAKHILKLGGSDFSFETEMLIETKFCNIPIVEIPISTVYIQNNKHSHFNPIKDSYKILISALEKNNA